MVARATVLDVPQRRCATDAIIELAAGLSWSLLAINVRSNHLHAVVAAPEPPERVITAMKAAATKALREADLSPPGGRVWSRHGSTRCTPRPRRSALGTRGSELGSAPRSFPVRVRRHLTVTRMTLHGHALWPASRNNHHDFDTPH